MLFLVFLFLIVILALYYNFIFFILNLQHQNIIKNKIITPLKNKLEKEKKYIYICIFCLVWLEAQDKRIIQNQQQQYTYTIEKKKRERKITKKQYTKHFGVIHIIIIIYKSCIAF